jgi:hypothetical protein
MKWVVSILPDEWIWGIFVLLQGNTSETTLSPHKFRETNIYKLRNFHHHLWKRCRFWFCYLILFGKYHHRGKGKGKGKGNVDSHLTNRIEEKKRPKSCTKEHACYDKEVHQIMYPINVSLLSNCNPWCIISRAPSTSTHYFYHFNCAQHSN